MAIQQNWMHYQYYRENTQQGNSCPNLLHGRGVSSHHGLRPSPDLLLHTSVVALVRQLGTVFRVGQPMNGPVCPQERDRHLRGIGIRQGVWRIGHGDHVVSRSDGPGHGWRGWEEEPPQQQRPGHHNNAGDNSHHHHINTAAVSSILLLHNGGFLKQWPCNTILSK